MSTLTQIPWSGPFWPAVPLPLLIGAPWYVIHTSGFAGVRTKQAWLDAWSAAKTTAQRFARVRSKQAWLDARGARTAAAPRFWPAAALTGLFLLGLAVGLLGLIALAATRFGRIAAKPKEGFGERLHRLARQRHRVAAILAGGTALELVLYMRLGHSAMWLFPEAIVAVIVVVGYLTLSTPAVRSKTAWFRKRDMVRQISEADKATCFARDQHLCAYCHRMTYRGGKGDRAAQFDHVVPHSRGGRSRPDNIVTACKKCNLKKGNSYDIPSRIVRRQLKWFYKNKDRVPQARFSS
jgi:5-methylcytosine-specific restriction endonuclease McrA